MINSPVFFCGIGGSGMLPLASIVQARGARVSGSDRTLDQGRIAAQIRFPAVARHRAIPAGRQRRRRPGQIVVTSAAIEETVPDVVGAKELGARQITPPGVARASCSTPRQRSIAVGGTSGKSTVTGMIGWILHAAGRDPTVMNGAVMKNFVTPTCPSPAPWSATGELFVSEVDESDGSIALYRPEVAVLNNITSRPQINGRAEAVVRAHFLNASRKAVVNLDDPETRALSETVPGDKRIGYGFDAPTADFMGKDLQLETGGRALALEAEGTRHEVRLRSRGATMHRMRSRRSLPPARSVSGSRTRSVPWPASTV